MVGVTHRFVCIHVFSGFVRFQNERLDRRNCKIVAILTVRIVKLSRSLKMNIEYTQKEIKITFKKTQSPRLQRGDERESCQAESFFGRLQFRGYQVSAQGQYSVLAPDLLEQQQFKFVLIISIEGLFLKRLKKPKKYEQTIVAKFMTQFVKYFCENLV